MRFVLKALLFASLCANLSAVDYPAAKQPGKANAEKQGNEIILSNNLMEMRWEQKNTTINPKMFSNKIEGKSYTQNTRKLISISTQKAKPIDTSKGIYLGIRLDANSVEALISADGKSWDLVKAFPHTLFPGKPSLIRLGKCSTKGDTSNYSTLGESGTSTFRELNVLNETGQSIISSFQSGGWKQIGVDEFDNITLNPDSMTISAPGNSGVAIEHSAPENMTLIKVLINKNSDKGMSWSPGIAVIWDSGEFICLNSRSRGDKGNEQLSLSTSQGENILEKTTSAAYPDFDITSDDLVLVKDVAITSLAPQKNSRRLGETMPGKQISAEFKHKSKPIRILWKAWLRDDSNYIEQKFAVKTTQGTQDILGFELIDMNLPNSTQIGEVPGSPVISGNTFLGAEVPVTRNFLTRDTAKCGFDCTLKISTSQSYSFSSVIGVYPDNQLRRAFLYYMERERAHFYKPFLHYNCWYDLGLGVNEEGLLDAINQFTKEMTEKRGVKIQAYLIDDGWDDPSKGLWITNTQKFPNDFTSIKKRLDEVKSKMGIWISPLGGYSGADQRTAHARTMGLIQNELDLAQPGYYKWYRDKCLTFMRDYAVSYFKWDRAGSGVTPHFMALLDIAQELRQENPDIFLNVTVGTWPSPFWLNFVDCTWRSGADVAWRGVGDKREQWITFRDGETYSRVISRAPLYPLNSIMHHGIVHGRHFQGAPTATAGNDLKNEARSYFGAGPNLQELYLTPSMLSEKSWDDVADAAKWASENQDVLADTHFFGGNPNNLEPYGYASWSQRKGLLMIRNPSDKPQTISLDLQEVFELPENAARTYTLKNAYPDQTYAENKVQAGSKITFPLEPFEVLVLEALPEKGQ